MAFLIVPFCFFICVATATDSRMPQPIQFYSHKEGPNPWKTVIIFEELGISYGTTFLEFGAAKGGVEHSDYLKKILAGRVPLIWDPSTEWDFTVGNKLDEYLVHQWLGFQSSSQGPFFAQALTIQLNPNSPPSTIIHFQNLAKRTLRTVDQALKGKQYLVGDKCTMADLAFVPWDLILDMIRKGYSEAATAEDREKLFPNWYHWHQRVLLRMSVKKMVEIQKNFNALK